MFLVALIILFIIVCISQFKLIMRRKTGKVSWGEPAVTIAQVILIILLVLVLAMDMSM